MIKDHEIQKFKKQPQLFAIRMNDSDVEKAVIAFVDVMLARDKSRRKYVQCPRKPNPRPQ